MQRKRVRFLIVLSAVLATALVAVSVVSIVAPRRGWATMAVPNSHQVQIEPAGGAVQIYNDFDNGKIFRAVDAKTWQAPPVVGDRSLVLPGVRWRQVDFAGAGSKWECTLSAIVPLALAGLLIGCIIWHARRVAVSAVGAKPA